MNVLIACEESQTVCLAFRRKGHNAFSCDLQSPSGGHVEWHILGDATKLLKSRDIVFNTMDGVEHIIPKWDLLIAHPPCTYLSNVCTRGFSLKSTQAEKAVDRWKKRAEAAVFFMYFALAPIECIAVENPVGFMNTAFRKADQIIDPYMFAESEQDEDNYVTKRTCLWTKNLPKLIKTNKLKRPDNKKCLELIRAGKQEPGRIRFTAEKQEAKHSQASHRRWRNNGEVQNYDD